MLSRRAIRRVNMFTNMPTEAAPVQACSLTIVPGDFATLPPNRQPVARAHNWLVNNFAITDPTGQGRYYYYYALERYGALAETETIGSVNWYTDH